MSANPSRLQNAHGHQCLDALGSFPWGAAPKAPARSVAGFCTQELFSGSWLEPSSSDAGLQALLRLKLSHHLEGYTGVDQESGGG